MEEFYLMLGMLLDFLGTIMLGYTVLVVHARMEEEKKFDGEVYKAIRKERITGIAGLILIALGFALQTGFYYFT